MEKGERAGVESGKEAGSLAFRRKMRISALFEMPGLLAGG
jgi:hypothetical protein